MSSLPISSKYRSTPNHPVDAVERESLVAALNQAFESDRIDQDTYRELLDRLFAAGTLGDLVPVVERLPATPTHGVPAIVEVGTRRPGEVSQASAPSGRQALMVAGGVLGAVLVIVVLLALLL